MKSLIQGCGSGSVRIRNVFLGSVSGSGIIIPDPDPNFYFWIADPDPTRVIASPPTSKDEKIVPEKIKNLI